MNLRLLAAASFVALCLTVPTTSHAEGPLVTIAPDGAVEDVRARPGVVLVDLYADW